MSNDALFKSEVTEEQIFHFHPEENIQVDQKFEILEPEARMYIRVLRRMSYK
jgi:hypothetical protein